MGESRDDRTHRALREVIGDEHAELALTHFATTRVQLSTAAPAARTPNGRLLFTVAANMLSRFVGELVLDWPLRTVPMPEVAGRALPYYLREIDTRPGKRVVLEGDGPNEAGPSNATVVLQIGRPDRPTGRGPVVSVGCSGWRAWISTVGNLEEVVSSTVPFGALCAACFAVAEVFKLTVLGVLEPEERERFRGRMVDRAHYSAWTAEWVSEAVGNGEPTAPLLPVDLGSIVQVGAGAVGNATAWALAHLPEIDGCVRALDAKLVDARNLNRCLGFREADVGRPKTEVLMAALPSTRLRWEGLSRSFDSERDAHHWLYLSTVDNNAVRHQMQEALPQWLVQGSTNGTQIAVSVHRPLSERSCLVCRHPDRSLGLTIREDLSVSDAAEQLGVTVKVVEQSQFNGSEEITEAFLAQVGSASSETAAFFAARRSAGVDLCGAISEFRRKYGAVRGPEEPSVPFASAFAGFQAAAEAVKLALRRAGIVGVPVLDNVMALDMSCRYTRQPLSYSEPPYEGCPVCQLRRHIVEQLYRGAWGPS